MQVCYSFASFSMWMNKNKESLSIMLLNELVIRIFVTKYKTVVIFHVVLIGTHFSKARQPFIDVASTVPPFDSTNQNTVSFSLFPHLLRGC